MAAAHMVDYDVIAALSKPGLPVKGNPDGSWTVERACETCRVTVQLPHPQYADLDAFRIVIANLGCFANWQVPRGTHVTVTVRDGQWHVVDRHISPDADFAAPPDNQPCPTAR